MSIGLQDGMRVAIDVDALLTGPRVVLRFFDPFEPLRDKTVAMDRGQARLLRDALEGAILALDNVVVFRR